MTSPNPKQRELIENTEGLYCVDAGAGTGKTFAVTRRYARIVDRDGVTPEDVLLVTFTTNAATEMRERIVTHSSYGMRDLADAPIRTFHAFCHRLLLEFGHDAPQYLGIDDRITDSTRIVENELVEAELFREFVDAFGDDHPEYDDVFRVLSRPTGLLDLLAQLAAKGVFPTRDGWFRNGERHLDGDFEEFRRAFDEANEPRNDGRKQSRLRSKLGSYGRNQCFLPDAPDRAELRGSGTKRVPERVARLAFEEDRSGLKSFVHDVYFEYLRFALRRNYLTFGFLQLFAFVLLVEDHGLREATAFEYVMIDEFQDTSELQFKLALLLAGTENLCAVGDWKQSIYGFQYADVANIVDFEDRLDRFVAELNDDRERVTFETAPVTHVELVENYRSTQAVLDFSEHALAVPAAKRDPVDVEAVSDRITSLAADTDRNETHVEAFRFADEPAGVVGTIQDVVGNDEYRVEGEDGELRAPRFEDIAVLTRTRAFGRDLLSVAGEYGVPMAYEGGIELFRTDQAKLLLAWLRILESDADRGWAVVLERAGYTLDEIRHVLETATYPAEMRAFRDRLAGLETPGGVAERVFARYGYGGPTADVVLATVQSVHRATTMTHGDLVRFIERGIDAGSTHVVYADAGTDSVTVQTIHAAKGLEYPIVILANMNRGGFPPGGGGNPTVFYEEPVGLRQRKEYATADDLPHVYDNWRAYVLRRCLPRDYDEERRLLYVAITRAESHVLFTAGETPNRFLEELPVEVETLDAAPAETTGRDTEQTRLAVTMPTPDGPVGHTPHTLMDDEVFEGVEGGEGTDFGTRVHEFAEAYALGESVEPEDPDERHVRTFLDGLDGELRVEVDAYLPLSVDGEDVTISGIIDLVHVRPDRVEVVDYKTDRGRHAQAEYRKQLGVYYHVVREAYPERAVAASIFYTEDGERVAVEPPSIPELEAVVANLE